MTKRLAEDLSRYLKEQGLRCKWLHSELDAFERVTILRELREGAFDALVGVNLLREGLDLPEVSMVCILDADKEGFLRSETSLIQTIGRSARHVNAEVVLYADKVTQSMQRAIDETKRRRDAAARLQPRARDHARDDRQGDPPRDRGGDPGQDRASARPSAATRSTDANEEYLDELEAEMLKAAENAGVRARRGPARPDHPGPIHSWRRARPSPAHPPRAPLPRRRPRPRPGRGGQGGPRAEADLTSALVGATRGERRIHAIAERPAIRSAERANAMALIDLALVEDLGEVGDLTSTVTIPSQARGAARFAARSEGTHRRACRSSRCWRGSSSSAAAGTALVDDGDRVAPRHGHRRASRARCARSWRWSGPP